MASAKQEAIKLIHGLDEHCSLDDIQYHLYVRQKVERGLRALEEGNYLTHEEVKEKFARWLR